MTSRLSFSRMIENDHSFTVGSRSYDSLHRNRLDYDRQRLIADALRAFRLNPLVRRIVKLYRYFALGGNLSIEVRQKPGAHARRVIPQERLIRTQKFLQEFWQHPLNQLDEQVHEWFDERTLTGELFLLFSVDPSGMCLVRAVPAESITSIRCAPNDYRQELTYHTGTLEDKAWPAYDPLQGQVNFMRHYVINRPVGSTWGESDLFPLLPWISRYTGWLENRATLNYWRQIFVWVVKGKYKSSEERLARQKEIEASPPRPGAILVGDESETWETVSPELDSFEAGADGLALKKQIASGAGIPIHYLAEPESATRTTAEAAGTPTFRNFEDYQNSFFNILRDVAGIACRVRRTFDPGLLPEPQFVIHGQDITEKDNTALSLAFSRSVQAAGELYDRKMIDTREFLRLAYQSAGQVYDGQSDQPEGLHRPLNANKSRAVPGNPSIKTPPIQIDPETGEVLETV